MFFHWFQGNCKPPDMSARDAHTAEIYIPAQLYKVVRQSAHNMVK